MRIRTLLFAAFMPFLAVISAQAQAPFAAAAAAPKEVFTALDPDNIRAFLEKSDALATGQLTGMSADDVSAWLGNHVSDQASFHSQTRFTPADGKTRTSNDSFTKAQFIANVQQGMGALKGDQTQLQIQNLTLSADKKSASMKTSSTDKGTAEMPDGKGGTQSLPISGQSDCRQTLALSTAGYIQMVTADCTTAIRVEAAAKPAAQ